VIKSRTTFLLLCGIFSSLLYAAMTVFISLLWDDYRSASQTISELSAIGAPTRSVWVLSGLLYTALVIGFGWGVWTLGTRNRSLRVAGALLLVYGGFGLVWPFAPMHLREAIAAGGATFSDTLHLITGGVTVVVMLLAIGFAAAALSPGFRVFSLVTAVILLAFGVLTSLDAPKLSANMPTPWIGVWERISVGAFMLWVTAFAAVLLRRAPSAERLQRLPDDGGRGGTRRDNQPLARPEPDEVKHVA
jgi:hypothetical protein